MRLLRVLLVATAFAHPSSAFAQLEAVPYATGLSQPVAFVADPTSASRQFVVEKGGLIKVVVNGVVQATEFLDLRTAILSNGERGLLGMAMDSAYASNGRFYVFFTRAGAGIEAGGLTVARFKRSAANPAIADPTTRFDLGWISLGGQRYIRHDQFSNHNGGCIAFGPDGYLYIGTGDGGGGDDSLNTGQNASSLLGKMLRIDVNVPDGDTNGYRVPADNPFVDNNPINALGEIWAFGLRNPWRFSFDHPAHGGALIIGDVGQNAWEEVDYEGDRTGGRNYGWPIREGLVPTPTRPDPPPPAYLPLTDPVLVYDRNAGRSVTGGIVYRGEELGVTMQGRYFYADFISGRIWSAAVTRTGPSAVFSNLIDHTPQLSVGAISSFGTDLAGEMYLVSFSAGTVYRVRAVCTSAVTPGVTSFSAGGGTGTLRILPASGCSWTASPSTPWITAQSSASGSAAGTFVFRVAPNPTGIPRNAVIRVGTTAVPIAQTAAPPILGDFDGLSGGDILWQRSDGTVAIWFMRGAQLASGEPFGPGAIADPQWRLAASGDLDGDGSRDAVFQHAGDRRLAVWLMSGATMLRGVALTPSSLSDANWRIRGAGDLNGDGRTDLVWQHQITGQVAAWLMNGTSLLDGRLLSPSVVSDTDWEIVGVADMNRDGHADLVWHHQTSGHLAVWFMNRTTLASGMLLTPSQVPDTSWKVRAVADLDGDGFPDLVWRNNADGRVAVWFLRGATQDSGTLLNPPQVTDGSWQIVGPR